MSIDCDTAQWIHFLLESNIKHKEGYTLYKIVGFRQSRNSSISGEFVEKLTVWQRYSRILELQASILARCKKELFIADMPKLRKPAAFRANSPAEVSRRQSSSELFFDYLSSTHSDKLTKLLDEFLEWQNWKECINSHVSEESEQPRIIVEECNSQPEAHGGHVRTHRRVGSNTSQFSYKSASSLEDGPYGGYPGSLSPE